MISTGQRQRPFGDGFVRVTGGRKTLDDDTAFDTREHQPRYIKPELRDGSWMNRKQRRAMRFGRRVK